MGQLSTHMEAMYVYNVYIPEESQSFGFFLKMLLAMSPASMLIAQQQCNCIAPTGGFLSALPDLAVFLYQLFANAQTC